MLGRLIPEKQLLNDQLKQVQQNSLHRKFILKRFSAWRNMYIVIPFKNDWRVFFKIFTVSIFLNRRFISHCQKSFRSKGVSMPATS